MKMIYTQQAVVRVWRNLKMLGKVPTSHFGHAAVTVMGNCVKTTDFDNPHMQNISFWPGGEGAGFHNAVSDLPGCCSPDSINDKINEMNHLTAIRLEVAYCRKEGIMYPREWNRALREADKKALPEPLTGQKRIAESPKGEAALMGAWYSLKDGTKVPVPAWSQSPQTKICLPGIYAKGKSWGLNTTRMGNWWIDFQKTNPEYRAFSPAHNCVGIALEGLHEGGAEAFMKIPKVRAYGEPVQVEQYARELERALELIERETTILQVDREVRYCSLNPIPANQLIDGIWTPANWKKASALGVLYRRSPLIVEIDDLLERFFRLTWKYAFVEKYELFVRLFRAVLKHRQDKSDSKRSYAVAQLGSQILDILARYGLYDGYHPVRA